MPPCFKGGIFIYSAKRVTPGWGAAPIEPKAKEDVEGPRRQDPLSKKRTMIHQYKLNGYNIVLDVDSGAIHAVDDLAYDLIEQMDREGADSLQPEGEALDVYNEILQLKKAGKLWSSADYEPLAGKLKERSRGIVKALCLHVAHTCNLNCSYCFASQGNFKGERALMSFEVGKRALDFLVENSGARRNLEVDFFGGEPLMNFQVVKDLVAYARSIEKDVGKNFRFTLTTNGVLVDDDVIDFANRECHNVVLSLDGRQEVNDRFRKDYSGQGSWEKIVPKFQHFVEKRGGKNYYMRGTFTHNNPDFLEDIKEMLRLGFTELSMEPVVCAPDDPFVLTDEDIEVVKDQYEKLAELMLRREKEGRPFTFYHYMIDLGGGPCIYKRLSGCGSGTEYMAVTPWGELFPCHQFVGDDAYSMGDIWKGVTNTALRDRFACCKLQCLFQGRVQGMLGKAILLGRLRGKQPARVRLNKRHIQAGLRAFQKAHGMCYNACSCKSCDALM